MSPKADTVEDLQRRRKRLHVGMAKLAYDDLDRQVTQVQVDAQVRLLCCLEKKAEPGVRAADALSACAGRGQDAQGGDAVGAAAGGRRAGAPASFQKVLVPSVGRFRRCNGHGLHP